MHDMYNKYMEHLRAINRAQSTISAQRLMLKRFLIFLETNNIKDLSDVDANLLLLYQQHVHSSRSRFNKPHSIAGQNYHLIAVKLFFKYLIRTGNVSKDPTLHLDFSRQPHRLPVNILSEDEMIRLLSAPDLSTAIGMRDRSIMEIFYSSGIRRNELLNLNISDIWLDSNRIHIREGKYRKDRVVPLGAVAEKYLRLYLDHRSDLLRGSTSESLYLSYRGRKYNDESLRKMLIRYGKQVCLNKKVHPHLFRHCCACHLLDHGAGVAHLQILLGHSSLSTTTRYLQVSISSLREVHRNCHPREIGKDKLLTQD